MENKPKVSILCITYNQEKYVRQTLESFIMQKTDFDFEILIHDDASTDKTVHIIKEFEKKHSKIIRLAIQKENQFSKGFFGVPAKTILQMARGDYFAFCEGDDYWTDPDKLQKQADLLDENPNLSMCFHSAKVLFENKESNDYIYPDSKSTQNFAFEELLKLNFIQTSSVMYRRQEYEDFPTNILPVDWYLHLYHAKLGKIGFIDEVMSVYRRHAGGIWWESSQNMDNLHLKYGIEEFNFYKNVYEVFTNKSKEYLEEKMLPFGQYLINLFSDHGEFKKLEKFSSLYHEYCDLMVDKAQKTSQEVEVKEKEKADLIQQKNQEIPDSDKIIQQRKEISNDIYEYDPNFINIKLSPQTVFVYSVRKALQKAIDRNMHFFRGILLDLGCGEMPYRQYLLEKNKNITKYIGVDIDSNQYHQSVKPDLFWDGKKIDLINDSVETVMATELFEHISNIEEILAEIRRVLSVNGLLFFTVPFVWPLHETPYDEFRYTPYSLQRILTKSGFRDIVIEPLGGYNASLAQMLGIWITNNRGKSLTPLRRKMSEKFEKYILYPVIENLLKRDAKLNIKTYGENTMPTGFYGYAKK
ncbi:MAG TPA: glycosyltransferase [Candidatus Kapabacteria bacterium]|nr:glycosyltransferase [Candidatus Kapabacteria bacterium]